MNDELLIPMLERYAQTRDTALRDELFERFLPLARAVARKFTGRGAELEDLEQVASMALLKALTLGKPLLYAMAVMVWSVLRMSSTAWRRRTSSRMPISPLKMPLPISPSSRIQGMS